MTKLFSEQSSTAIPEVVAIEILIVDDQKVVRTRIEEVLSAQKEIKVVGTAAGGEQAIALIKSLKPHVVLIDIEMPGMDGIEVIKILNEQFPLLKLIVISSHDKDEYVRQTIENGAAGYVLKHTSAADLVAAIHAVENGSSYLGAGLLKKIQQVSEQKSTQADLKKHPTPPKNPQDACKIVEPSPASSTSKAENNSIEGVSYTNIANLEQNLSVVEVEEFLPKISKWLTWGGVLVMLILASIIPVSSVLKYNTKVKALATIRPEGNVRLVQAEAEGTITEILIKPGDKIGKGEVIATIDPFRIQSEKNQARQAFSQQKLQLAQLNAQLGTIERQIIAEIQRNNSEILAAEAELSGSQRAYQDSNIEANSEVEEAQAQLKAAEATLEAAKNTLTRYQAVAVEGALSKEQLAEARLEVARQQQEIGAARARLNTALAVQNPSNAEVEIAQQNIQQLEKSGLAAIASLNREQEALVQQRIEAQKQLEQQQAELSRFNKELEQTKIKATDTGVISHLELRNPGELVQIGEEIAQIIPKKGDLTINAMISPQDIGKIELGQNMEMRVSACIYTDYGLLNAKVSDIAKDVTPTESNNPSSNNLNSNPTASQSDNGHYKITATPKASTFGKPGFQCDLKTGMQGSAEIITREETAIQFILRKARLISNI